MPVVASSISWHALDPELSLQDNKFMAGSLAMASLTFGQSLSPISIESDTPHH